MGPLAIAGSPAPPRRPPTSGARTRKPAATRPAPLDSPPSCTCWSGSRTRPRWSPEDWRARPGFFHRATVLAGVRQEDEIFRGEVFGPVVTIQPFTRKGEDFGWRTPFRRLWPQAYGPATTIGPRARVVRCIPASPG
ncbi:aldehyde dehydrogenase family protein [Streptomyces sp. YKOK-J1]